ncbi:MAG: BtpA/SgcQ family protein, partial [Bdellovibrionota bacterium]
MNLPSLVGVVHLPALAGAPGSHGLSPHQALERAGLQAVREARALRAAGFEAVILENFGDIPFYKTRVPAETIASMAVISAAVREGAGLPVGLNFLRNDGRSALAVASVTGAQFIRVNVLSGVAATDQGIIEGDAAELIRERERLHSDVAILADVHVKHARSLSSEDIALAVEEVAQRAMAEGVVVSGATTGRSVDPRELERASEAARSCRVPLYIGSGATPETLSELCRYASGIIVSSALRKGGVPGAALDLAR